MQEAVAVGRSFAAAKGYQLDGNKEMVAMGFMNIAGSCSSCYVATGGCFSIVNSLILHDRSAGTSYIYIPFRLNFDRRVVLEDGSERECGMQDDGFQRGDGDRHSGVVGAADESVVLHANRGARLHHPLRPPRPRRHQGGLQHLESGQDGFPGLHRCFSRRLVWIRRDRPSGSSESPRSKSNPFLSLKSNSINIINPP